MRFSQRKGFAPVKKIIQTDSMSDELRNSIWNALDSFLWSSKDFLHTSHGSPRIYTFSRALWSQFFKIPADERSEYASDILEKVREFFFSCEWYEVYDFIEWILAYDEKSHLHFSVIFNYILERELSGFRVIDGKIVDITNDQEVEMLQSAIDDTKFAGAATHLRRSLELLTDRNKPDYRNSMKEAISAVESIARAITDSPKATLSEALKALEKNGKLHPALKDGFLKLYGYTSDEEGIRHAMMDEPNITQADAKFMLLSCTSFVNYLKAQL